MKKLYLLALATMLSSVGFAAEKFTVDGVVYALLDDGSGVEVSSCELTGDIVIPPTVKNGAITYKVVAVGKNAFQFSEATSVVLPNTVKEVKNSAFNASDVVKVDLGSGIEVLGDGVFGFAREIEEISELPETLETITGNPFLGNFKLKEIKIAADNQNYKAVDGVLFSKSGQKLISYPYGKGVEYIIPEGVDTIGADVFNTFQDFQKVTFPSTLKVIQGSAFTYCTALVSTNDLPEGVTYIGSGAFSNCRKINLTVPSTVEKILGMAFNNNWSMESIHIPSGVQTIGNQAFAGASACTSLIIDEGVEEISEFCFQNLSKITRIVIPSTVTTVGSYSFSNCKNVKYLEIGENVETINVAAFNAINPDTIIVRAVTPPEYTNERYYMTGADCLETVEVFVPKASIDAYKSTWMWSFFTNYKPLEDITSGIEDVIEDKPVAAKTYYNLSGIKVAEPSSADGKLYIVVTTFEDGSTKTEKIVNF